MELACTPTKNVAMDGRRSFPKIDLSVGQIKVGNPRLIEIGPSLRLWKFVRKLFGQYKRGKSVVEYEL